MDNNVIIPGGGAADDTSNAGGANDASEDAEWDAAFAEYQPGLVKTTVETTTETTTQEANDEQTDTTTTTTTVTPEEVDTTTTATTLDPNETAEQKVQREQREADAAKAAGTKDGDGEEENALNQSTRTARQTARQAAREVEQVATDVRDKLYSDQPKSLQDKDGDPINSINDVMNLVNPNTGVGFTEEEAAVWLLSAQQKFNENLTAQDNRANEIAETLVDLKDQADSINYEYGSLLKSMPDLQAQLWTEYEKTLVKDPGTGIIVGAPVSMETFYDLALQPYIKLAESLDAQEQAKTAAETAEAATQKLRNRSDRSDVFGRGDVPNLDDEEKEWQAAHESYFGK